MTFILKFFKTSAIQAQGAEDEDFPRGGASGLNPLEVRKIREEAEKDVLFGVRYNQDKSFDDHT